MGIRLRLARGQIGHVALCDLSDEYKDCPTDAYYEGQCVHVLHTAARRHSQSTRPFNPHVQVCNVRVPNRPGKPEKMRVHLENLEISWNFEKFNKYHEK